MQIKEFQSEENAGERIDKFLTEKVPELSRSYIQKLIKEKNVKVNSTVIKSNYKVAKGDQIQITIPDLTEPDILPENIPLDILYEDDDILVVNKPKGMVVHPAAGHYTGTLVNAIMYHCKDRLSGINGVMRPGIVHRIDMDTTGSLLVCKNDTAHQILAEQLKEHSIKRIYHAIVHGNIKEDSGTVNAPIGRHPIDRKKMSINEKNGRNAVTHYRVWSVLANILILPVSLKPVAHIRSVCIWQVSIIRCLETVYMVRQNVRGHYRGRHFMRKFLELSIREPENIWNLMPHFRNILKIY